MRTYVLPCVSLVFIAAWLSAYADYCTENRLLDNKRTVAFDQLEYDRDQQLVEIDNSAHQVPLDPSQVIEHKVGDRTFEFYSVTLRSYKQRQRRFTFCQEKQAGSLPLMDVLASDGFPVRKAARSKLKWLMGSDQYHDFFEKQSHTHLRSEKVLIGFHRNSQLSEASIALGCWTLVALGLIVWILRESKSNGYWLRRLSESRLGDYEKFQPAMSLVGYSNTNKRLLTNSIMPVSKGTLESRLRTSSALLISLILMLNFTVGPIVGSLYEITSGFKDGSHSFANRCEMLISYPFGLIFWLPVLIPLLMWIFHIPCTQIRWSTDLTSGKRSTSLWSKGYLQYHETLIKDLGFCSLGDYQSNDSGISFYVSANKRVLVALGANRGDTGYQVYSMLSNGDLVVSGCWLARRDYRRIERKLSGQFVHLPSDPYDFLQALQKKP